MMTDISRLRPEPLRTTVAEVLTSRYPRLSKFVLSIETAPLHVPAVTDFEFHAPFGRIRIADKVCDAPKSRSVEVVFHQLCHFAQQLRRFRRTERVGVMQNLHIAGTPARYFPWEDVEASRTARVPPLNEEQRRILAPHAGSCTQCGRPPTSLAWVWFASPPSTWRGMCGFAGWMAVCDPCHEQVAFFAQRLS